MLLQGFKVNVHDSYCLFLNKSIIESQEFLKIPESRKEEWILFSKLLAYVENEERYDRYIVIFFFIKPLIHLIFVCCVDNLILLFLS